MVGLLWEGPEDDDGKDDGQEGVEHVPGEGGQPVADGIYSTHKLQVLGLQDKQRKGNEGLVLWCSTVWNGHKSRMRRKVLTLDSFSLTKKRTKFARRKL